MTVKEAAALLGITPDAVRSKLRRGKLRRAKAPDGTVLVVLGGDGHDGQTGQHDGRTTVAYIGALRSENELLRRELEAWQEEARRKDHIIMTMAQRIPELPPASPPTSAQQQAPQTAADEPEGVDTPDTVPQEGSEHRSSWWRRFFGFE